MMSDTVHDGLTIREMLYAVRRRKWTALVITASMTCIGLAIAIFSSPVYRAETLLSPESEDAGSGLLQNLDQQFGLASLAGFGAMSQGNVTRDAVAILQSRRFIIDFIGDENLMPILFPNLNELASTERPSRFDAYRMFTEKVLSVEEDPDNGLITVAMEWTDPELAATWANSIVAKINEVVRERAIRESKRSIEYLSKELEATSQIGVQQGIYGLIESHINTIALANAREHYAFKVIDPALARDMDDFVRPNRVLITVFFILTGTIAAFSVVVTLYVMHKPSQ